MIDDRIAAQVSEQRRNARQWQVGAEWKLQDLLMLLQSQDHLFLQCKLLNHSWISVPTTTKSHFKTSLKSAVICKSHLDHLENSRIRMDLYKTFVDCTFSLSRVLLPTPSTSYKSGSFYIFIVSNQMLQITGIDEKLWFENPPNWFDSIFDSIGVKFKTTVND